LPPDVDVDDGDITIEKILAEKKLFDHSQRFEKAGGSDGELAWSTPGECGETN
jgi:hypothetical protein